MRGSQNTSTSKDAMAVPSPTMREKCWQELALFMKSPISPTVLRRGRYVAGTVAAAGALAIFGGGSDTAHAQSSNSSSSYTIKSGDTLSAIAATHGTTVSAIASTNSISDHHSIVAGKKLTLPAAKSASGSTTSSHSVAAPKSATQIPTGTAIEQQLNAEAAAVGITPSLLKAVMWQESGWQNSVRSSAGATGIAQVMPGTVEFVNANLTKTQLDPAIPEENIRLGALYLRYLLIQTGWDTETAVASYYQGLNGVRSHGMYKDTQQYVRNVIALQNRHF
jgi:N-acetylmuramoyl-L-alanine amidase